MELMTRGDLKSYLRSMRPEIEVRFGLTDCARYLSLSPENLPPDVIASLRPPAPASHDSCCMLACGSFTDWREALNFQEGDVPCLRSPLSLHTWCTPSLRLCSRTSTNRATSALWPQHPVPASRPGVTMSSTDCSPPRSPGLSLVGVSVCTPTHPVLLSFSPQAQPGAQGCVCGRGSLSPTACQSPVLG